ncbi:alpha/beta hydrolase [Kitasatospora sp. NBC_00374]|uniref:alpha/beta fold hydrolase n=1 Tax=Kitasatospora sp. NBC_00374 TaxID=2975964 RepID=UPI0030E43AAF
MTSTPPAAAHTTVEHLRHHGSSDSGTVATTVTQQGAGRVYLLLHGGAGPQSVAPFADLLAADGTARVITPTHPGFAGTPRPDRLDTVAGLASLYRDLLDRLDVDRVTVVGNSIGGWIAAELALLHSPRVSATVLVNAVGIAVADAPVTDVSGLSPVELSRLSYHDPSLFRFDPAALTEPQRAVLAANRQALGVYGGPSMTDPTLRERLAGVTAPTLVLWGESDGIVGPAYGRAFARAVPGAEFVLLPGTGHVPQLETPHQLLTHVRRFAETAGG